MTRTIRVTMQIRNCDQVFREGLGKGVIGFQEVIFRDEPSAINLWYATESVKEQLVDDLLEFHIAPVVEEDTTALS